MKVRLVVVKGYEIPTDVDGTPYRPGVPMIHIWPADQSLPEGWVELEIAEPECESICAICKKPTDRPIFCEPCGKRYYEVMTHNFVHGRDTDAGEHQEKCIEDELDLPDPFV